MPEKRSTQRRRAGLRQWRLLLAPLLGAIVMTWAIVLLDDLFAEEEKRMQWRDLAIALSSPSLWSLVSGIAYLQTVTRMRDQIARYECLLLGCVSGFLWPVAMDIGSNLLFHGHLPALQWNAISAYSIGGLFTLPFGLFGGWVFWRLGVRPASPPAMNYAAVFD